MRTHFPVLPLTKTPTTGPTAYVLVSQSLGVYLGSFLGLAFWTLLDPVGQTEAVAFETPTLVQEFHATHLHSEPNDVFCCEVSVLPIGYATRAACLEAGITQWPLEETVVETKDSALA